MLIFVAAWPVAIAWLPALKEYLINGWTLVGLLSFVMFNYSAYLWFKDS